MIYDFIAVIFIKRQLGQTADADRCGRPTCLPLPIKQKNYHLKKGLPFNACIKIAVVGIKYNTPMEMVILALLVK